MDIWEDEDGITLSADMPGVSKDRLELRIDGNNLIIEGTFSLSGELETGQIEATLKDGVLTVRIPKRAELRPRKIDVQI